MAGQAARVHSAAAQHEGEIIAHGRDRFQDHVASPLHSPLVVLLEQDRTDQPVIAASSGKMPTTSVRRLTSLLMRSSGWVEWSLARCSLGKAGVGEHVRLGLGQEPCELR
jgi:hypothetical protein